MDSLRGYVEGFKANTVNEYFEKELLNFQLTPTVGKLYKAVVMDIFQSQNRTGLDQRKYLADKIEEQERILSNARKRYMTDEIDAEDFKAIKLECNEALRILEAKLIDMPNKVDSLKSVEGLLDIVIDKYSNILHHYKNASISDKRKLIGSMYPQNLCFDGTEHRTPYLNNALSLILLINSNLEGIKKGERLSFDNLSPLVALRGIEPFL